MKRITPQEHRRGFRNQTSEQVGLYLAETSGLRSIFSPYKRRAAQTILEERAKAQHQQIVKSKVYNQDTQKEDIDGIFHINNNSWRLGEETPRLSDDEIRKDVETFFRVYRFELYKVQAGNKVHFNVSCGTHGNEVQIRKDVRFFPIDLDGIEVVVAQRDDAPESLSASFQLDHASQSAFRTNLNKINYTILYKQNP